MKLVCIIGSGVAGSTLAIELLASGRFSVHMLEAGARVEMLNQRKWHDLIMQGTNPLGGSLDTSEFRNAGGAP